MTQYQQIKAPLHRYRLAISFYEATKRILDFVFALFLLILAIPFFVFISAIIFLETGSSPIYIQKRGITLDRKEFRIYKFRTLKKHKSTISSDIFIKEDLSSWVTLSGKILRRTGLDELPQLINVLIGDMSFIGPRPLSLNDLILLKKNEFDFYIKRQMLKSKPGISGYWQIYGNRQNGVKNLIELEEFYENNKSLLFDFFLIFMTIPIIIFAKHTDAIISKR